MTAPDATAGDGLSWTAGLACPQGPHTGWGTTCPTCHMPTAGATAGDGLREVLVNAIDNLFWKHDPANTDPGELRDDLLALPALRDVLAAAARTGEHRVAGWALLLADEFEGLARTSDLLADEFAKKGQTDLEQWHRGMARARHTSADRIRSAVAPAVGGRDPAPWLAAAARDAEAIKRVRKLAKWDGGEMAAAVLRALDGTP